MKLFQITEPESKTIDSPVVGIDLGTTNSLICYFDGEGVKFAEDSGSQLVPSVVAFLEDDHFVGCNALKRENAIHSIKRLMGEEGARVSGLAPEEISALILKYLKSLGEKQFGFEIKTAVITVPAYFSEAARNATKNAAKIAGIEVLRLISEPTAAAIAYGYDNSEEGKYLVYDLGGGTFDVTLLEMSQGIFRIIGTGGDTKLGGDDLDSILAKHLNIHKLAARKIREQLTNNDATPEISRLKFEELIYNTIETTIKITKGVLNDAKVNPNELNAIILVGGASRTPLIKQRIQEAFGIAPNSSLDPDRVVARGAALQAYNLRAGSNTLLLDVVPISLAIEVANGSTEKIIYRNSTLPITQKMTFTNQSDAQTAFDINILQGENENANECRKLATLKLSGLPKMQASTMRLDVTFQLDVDGILSITAHEVISDKKIEHQLKPSYGLTPDILSKLINSI